MPTRINQVTTIRPTTSDEYIQYW